MALAQWFREKFDHLQSLITLPPVRSGLRAAGAFSLLVFIVYNTPDWLVILSKHSPLLGFNLMIGIIFFIVKLWRRYGGDINVTAFRIVLETVTYVRRLSNEYLHVPSSQGTINNPIFARRKQNRKHVRTVIFFLLVHHTVVPDCSLCWFQSLCAFNFLTDFCKYFWTDANRNDDATDGKRHFRNVVHFSKGLLSVNILFYQMFYISGIYFTITLLYFVLVERYLERPLTFLLVRLQSDLFEGMEQYYITAVLAALELLLCLAFSLWILFQNKQLLMLVALYTNIYSSAREFVQDSVTDAILEWTTLAQFERASKQEIADYDDVCAICLSNMKTARKTACNHIFHGHCLRRCVKEKPSCPMCASPVKM